MNAPLQFEALRQRGVDRSQTASGEVWTDYNAHDPGVTLLELFCFALTELDYRADFPVADLLTDPDGVLDFEAQALAVPDQALPTAPVTRSDWEAALSYAAPSVARTFVRPHMQADGEALPGLYEIYVVPAEDSETGRAQALSDVRAAFYARRNLCEDLARLDIAQAIDVELIAEIALVGRDAPEKTAARIYDICDRLLQGVDATPPPPATRRDVADAPERYFGPATEHHGDHVSAVELFDAVADIDQVAGVLSMTFAPPLDAPPPCGAYRRIRVPRAGEDANLRLSVADRATRFDIQEMRVELARLRADRRLKALNVLDQTDWRSLPRGRRRLIAHAPLGPGLPNVYLADGESLGVSARPEERGAAAQIRGFLAHFDGVLASAAEDIAHLYDLFSARDPTGPSYFGGAIDIAAVLRAVREASAPNEVDLTDVVARRDHRRERKGRALDHLLALYAEAFSQNSLRRYDLYRSVEARQDSVLHNRARLLCEAPALHLARFAGGQSGGFARKLAILLDMPLRSDDAAAGAFDGGLAPAGQPRRAAPRIPLARMPAAADPLAALAPRFDPPPVDPAVLARETVFLRCETPDEDIVRAGALQDAWLLAPVSNHRWRLFFVPDVRGPAFLCRTCRTREDAVRRANQLRAAFAEANRRAETLYIVEDILLRSSDSDAAAQPMFLWAAMPGWTARTVDLEFRELAEETIVGLCPAHISHRTVWLDRADMATFETLFEAHAAARAHYEADGGSETPDDAGRRLRDFLRARGSPD